MGFRGQRPQGQPRMNNQGGLGKSFSQPGPVPQPMVQQMPPQPVAMVPPTGMPPMGIPPNLPPQIVEYIMKGRQIIPGVVPQNPNYKNIVGEFIYEYVEQISGEEKAPKITGMLIDLQIPEIHGYLSDFGRLQQKIQEANVLLNSQQ